MNNNNNNLEKKIKKILRTQMNNLHKIKNKTYKNKIK